MIDLMKHTQIKLTNILPSLILFDAKIPFFALGLECNLLVLQKSKILGVILVCDPTLWAPPTSSIFF